MYIKIEYRKAIEYLTLNPKFKKTLTDKQRKRLRFIFMGYSIKKIAQKEGVCYEVARKSVKNAVKKINKIKNF